MATWQRLLVDGTGAIDTIAVQRIFGDIYAGAHLIVDTTQASTISAAATAGTVDVTAAEAITDTTRVSDIDAAPVATIERTV